MYLLNPAKFRLKFISFLKRIQHRRELKIIQSTLADAETHLLHHKQQLAFLYGLKAKRLHELRIYDKCLQILSSAIEMLSTVEKNNKDREAMCVLLSNLAKIYASFHDHKAVMRAQENIIALHKEMLEAKESVVIATNWELNIKDQMLAAKDTKLQEQLGELKERTRTLKAATSELKSLKGRTNGKNGLQNRNRKSKKTIGGSNTTGLAGDVGKLVGQQEYLGAFMLAITLFEHELVNWQSSHSYHFDSADKSIRERLDAVPRNLFNKRKWQSIETAIEVWHKIVYDGKNVLDEKRASRLIKALTDISSHLREECQDKSSLKS